MSASHTPEPGSERTLRSGTRNPRRRPRQSDGDTLRTTAPRRKRSKLSEHTFAPRASDEDEPEPETKTHEDLRGGVAMNGGSTMHGTFAGRQRKASLTPSITMMELPVRGGKKGTPKRALKGDGATVLQQNKLRQPGVEYRGALGVSHLALAVTREHAYVWDYMAHTQVNNARVFDVPFRLKPSDPLPFGSLVTSGASADVGLVLVSATKGEIVFFESIDRTLTLGLFQERNTGVQGSLGGLFSGETVTAITSADHAGFILTLSSGRIAQLTLRDAQGKARVFTQLLRPSDQSSSGIFGSIRGLIGAATWKRDVAAVHTRALGTRGQIQVVSLTEKAEVQMWDVDWSGRYEFRGMIDFRDALAEELKSLESAEMHGRMESVVALDFVIIEKVGNTRRDEVAAIGAEQALHMWVLLRMGTSCNLAELSWSNEGTNVTRILPLDHHHAQGGHSRPTLVLPKAGHTAVVAFEDAIVLAATSENEPEPDPDAQLHGASYIETGNFEDAVFLRSDKDLSILGAVQEEGKSGIASTIAFIKSAGLVRISAVDPAGDVERAQISAKSKIEQAVFYGALQDNIIDFSRKIDSRHTVADIEEAALTISDETLRSGSSFLSSSPTSIEAQLTYKAQALRALTSHLRQNCPPLSRSVMWQLLWNAERVAAAQQMWRIFEEYSAAGSAGRRKASIFDELCLMANQSLGLNSGNGAGEGDDTVRSFFVKELPNVGWLLAKARQLVEAMRESSDTSTPEKVLRIVMEADDVWVKSMEAVFAFRADNAAKYGITSEFTTDGILTDSADYLELPEPWTSTLPMLKSIVPITSHSREIAKELFERDADPEPIIAGYVSHVIDANPRLVQLICLLYQERIQWLTSRTDARSHDTAHKLARNFEATRYEEFRALQGAGQTDGAMRLAEKYNDMHTLTELVVAESQYALDVAHATQDPREKAAAMDNLGQTVTRIGRYFDKFGEAWANAFFDEAFSSTRAGRMLDEAQLHWREALTKYLRADASRAKICWINDVVTEKDFKHAADVLAEAGVEQEAKLWAKKVELSMSKMALMAAREGDEADATASKMKDPESGLEMVEIQEKLYQHLLPEIVRSIDRDAELGVAMKKFGTRNPDLSSLKQLLSMALDRALDHDALSTEELIDVLTLMDVVVPPAGEEAEGNLQGAEFYLALRTLNAAAPSLPHDRFETLLQLIWKRCYVSDDWVAINKLAASKKHTADDVWHALRNTAAWRTLYVLHSTTLLTQPDSAVRVLAPTQCVGAGCMPQHLAYRFADAELLDPILRDNKIQDELLQSYVTDRRVEEWVRDCEGDARERVEQEAEELSRRLGLEREFEMRLARESEEGKKANGHVSGTVSDSGGGDVGMRL